MAVTGTAATGDREREPVAIGAMAPSPGEAVRERVRRVLRDIRLAEAHEGDVQAALAVPGNVLSEAPNYRWARLAWTCCAAAGGRWQQAVPTAAALEIFMVALDVLDDIEDSEETPLLACLGIARATNVSTMLLLLAQRALLDRAGPVAVLLLLDAGLRACNGQHADLSPPPDRPRDLEEALAVTAAKSATLVSVTCRLGAHCAGADTAVQERYAQFGAALGMIAQLANDLAAIGPDATGKTDIALGRPTLPLVYAATRASATGARSGDPLDRTDNRDQGPLLLTWVVAETYRRHALELIPALTTDRASRRDLADLVCIH